jgi:hypothetical protein
MSRGKHPEKRTPLLSGDSDGRILDPDRAHDCPVSLAERACPNRTTRLKCLVDPQVGEAAREDEIREANLHKCEAAA